MFEVNYIAVLVSAVAAMIVGALWYSPLLLGKPWMKLVGMDDEKIAAEKKKGMGKAYGGTFVAAIISAYVLSYLINGLGLSTVSEAVMLAFLAWVGFTAAAFAGDFLFLKRPCKLFFITTGHYLAGFIVMAIVLVLWR